MANVTTNVPKDNWIDIKSGGIKNIRVKGTYPAVHKKDRQKYYQNHYHPRPSYFLMNQHKPYGMATLGLLDPFDDRPDWFMFKTKKQKRKYEEITPQDREEFREAMEQDRDMHISHHHVHIKEIEQRTKPSDEIAGTVEL